MTIYFFVAVELFFYFFFFIIIKGEMSKNDPAKNSY